MTTTSRTEQATAASRRAERIHDFTAKLRQPAVLPMVVDYLKWQRALRRAREEGREDPATPSENRVESRASIATGEPNPESGC